MTAQIVDENGYITIESNPISRAGVFEYLGRSIGADEPDRIYKVYRPAEELQDPECLASFQLLPIVDDHEMLAADGGGLTDPADYGIHGTTGETVEFKDGVLYSTLKILSGKLAGLIKQGKKDLSLGYRCVYEKANGIFAGESYDYIQRSLRGNHLALVDQARCNVSVLDSLFTYDSIDLQTQKDVGMEKTETKDELSLESLAARLEELAAVVKALTPEKAAEVAEELADVEEVVQEASGDEDKDEEKKTEDEELKDDKTEGGNNDAGKSLASGLDSVAKKVAALDASMTKRVMAEISQRDALAKQLAPHIGTFDHSEKTLAEVAQYGIKKLGLTAAKGHESAVLSGYLAAAKKPVPQAALDSKRASSLVDKYIKG